MTLPTGPKLWLGLIAVAMVAGALFVLVGPKVLAWLAAGTAGAVVANEQRKSTQKKARKQHAATTAAHAAELAEVNAWGSEARAAASKPPNLATDPPEDADERARRLKALQDSWEG
jgi:hypothetical protein